MSLVLRHKPEAAGVDLDAQGWCEISKLVAGINSYYQPGSDLIITQADIDEVVRTDEKNRYAISEDGRSIRANQGHSLKVELDLSPKQPPEVLYHGTVDRFVSAIKAEGLKKMNRHHVHLSADRKTAESVGERRGKPVILVIRAGDMARNGTPFYLSENGVWLVDYVPSEYLEFP